MANEITQFKYEQLDGDTADFLRQKESNMREIVGKAYTELGRELTEARDRLAGSNQYDGVFRKWCDSIGMKKDTVNRLIQRYELVANCDDQTQELLEDMPISLTYEIAKPSAESTPAKTQAKSEVLAGEIETLKEYRERIKELERKAEQAEQAAEIERRERERLEEENAELIAEQMSKEDEAYDEPETESIESRTPYGAKLGQAMYGALRELSEWQKEYSWIITDANEFRKMYEADANFAREFTRVREFWKQLEMAVGRNEGSTVVDADFSVIN